MTDLTIPTPECFKPLAQPSRYKTTYGGRGSGKSWHFASMIVEHCLLNPDANVVCIREVQKTLNQSAETPGGGLSSYRHAGHECRKHQVA